MKAVMLAAGIGVRLGNSETRNVPKVLLRFGGESLLQRHIDYSRRNCLFTNGREGVVVALHQGLVK